MTRIAKKIRLVAVAGSVLAAIILQSGCAVVGPNAIKAGRVAYAEAINQTQDEQILLSVVKGRYGESTTLLAVNSVAANMRFRAEVGAQAGFDGVGDPDDNLLKSGLAYEENPTITYAPVQGENYIRQLMSPVPLDLLVLVLRSSTLNSRMFGLLVNRINDLRNPAFLDVAVSEPNPAFKRLLDLMSQLSKDGVLELVQSTQKGIAFDVWFNPQIREDETRVAEVLELLGLPKREDKTKAFAIPVHLGIRVDQSWGIGLTTRSTFELVEIMRAAIEVPEPHATAGLSVTYPPAGLAGQGIRIHSSTSKPEGQSVAVKYRRYWFWIDEADHETKTAFRLLRTLWSISIAGATSNVSAPVLTIPVGY